LSTKVCGFENGVFANTFDNMYFGFVYTQSVKNIDNTEILDIG